MPITKSAKKALRVSQTKRALNQKRKISLAKALKNVDAKTVNQTVSIIDKSAKANLIHPNKAARLKSALAKKFGTPAEPKKAAPKATAKAETKKAAPKKDTAKKTAAKKTTKTK